MILAIRTDKPESELYIYNDTGIILDTYKWLAHRQLSDTLLSKMNELLKKNQLSLTDIDGIVVYAGPGSFTGLRIGVTVANTLAYSLNVPIVGSSGDSWIESGFKKIKSQTTPQIVIPKYGSEAYITPPRK